MKKSLIFVNGIMFLLLLCLCTNSLAAEDRIAALETQILNLEKQKEQLETENQKLIAESDELSQKIESLKIQARGGLGIIGKYKLSRRLRKAQNLSREIQSLEKKIYQIEAELKGKREELEKEYESEIAILLEKLNGGGTEEKGKILEKVKKYQAAKEQLIKQEKRELETLDITKIKIEDYDGPQEIREKADLINDFAGKLDDRIEMLNTAIKKLGEEFKTRERLGEFAEEISFFGERVSREEIAGIPPEETAEERAVKDEIPIEIPTLATDNKTLETETLSASPAKLVVEKNGVSADFEGTSLDQIEQRIKLLEKQKQELKKELTALSEKAGSFRKKADEIEKSETKKGGKKL